MAEKKYPSRVQHKSGTSAEWGLATNFKPLEGELLVYTDAGGTDKDGKSIPQLKIGDGNTLVANLPFVGSKETEHAESAESAKEAEHATSADTASTANHAVSADTATVATTANKVDNSLTFKKDGTNIHSYNGSAAKTINFKAGSNVTLSSNTSGDLTINATDTVYTHDTHSAHDLGFYKVHVDDKGHVIDVSNVQKSDITALGIPEQDTTYSEAGTSLGLVKSGGDVTISSGVITVNDDSHAHVIDNIDGLQTALDGKSGTSHTHTNASMGQGYATCGTSEAVTAKAAVLAGYTLVTGGIVSVKFAYAVPASSTLNISATGAKNIRVGGSAIQDGHIPAGTIATFVYDGTYYHLIATDYGCQAGTIAFNQVSTLSSSLTNNYYNKTSVDAMFSGLVIDDGSID